MDKQLLNKIIALAKKICESNSKFSRADLAYELRGLGISGDSEAISRLVWEAWLASGKDENILHAFTNNEGTRPLVECYRVAAALDNGDSQNAIDKTLQELHEASDALIALEKSVREALSDEDIRALQSVASTITGTAGVQRVAETSRAALARYTNMVDGYEAARCNVQEAASAFVELRSDIHSSYQQYVFALTDVFGDSVRSIAPELFNFDSIEWLDVQNMLSQIELQYTTVASRCTNLLSEISDSFKSSLQSSLTTYRSLNNKQAGLIMAGLSMMGHYLDAASRTKELQADFTRLKNDMRRDATHIQADMGRLAVIYKKLNDIFIPQATTFYRFSNDTLSRELHAIEDAVYASPQSKKLKAQRDEGIASLRMLERRMNDESANINYYQGHITECESLLASMKEPYQSAIASRPQKPFFLLNWLSFGNANANYNRRLYEWNQSCGSLVKQYEGAMVDLNLDKDDLKAQQLLLKQDRSQFLQIKGEVDALSRKMMNELKADPKAKTQMLAHLKDIVALLRVAKSILENKLDDKDIRTRDIKDFGALEIPESVQQNIDTFCENFYNISNELSSNVGESIRDITMNSPEEPTDISPDAIPDAQQFARQVPFSQALNLAERYAQLEALKHQDAKAAQFYQQQLDDIKAQFQKEMQQINDRSALLRTVIANANTALSPDDLKRALLSLTDIPENSWSDSDWDEFLSGRKTLEI